MREFFFTVIRTTPNTSSNFNDRIVHSKLNPLIEQWQRICILAERIIKRREAAAVRSPPAFRRSYLPTHFTLPHFSPTVSSSPLSTASSILSISSNMDSVFGSRYDHFTEQGDLARLTNTLRAVTEVNQPCWRGDECELSNGVCLGLEQVAAHTQRHSELSELRVRTHLLLREWY